MEIAEVTESFGKELAEKWSNEASAVNSSDTNIGEFVFHANLPLCFVFCLILSKTLCGEPASSAYTRFVK